ncbi:MAG: hypothetical protein FWD16_07400, partial [Clostridia bacterium]|nr:hypothetical protein [Clostridia bacterium]
AAPPIDGFGLLAEPLKWGDGIPFGRGENWLFLKPANLRRENTVDIIGFCASPKRLSLCWFENPT